MEKISPIKRRILKFIEYKGITKQHFCEKTGISYANIKGKSLESEFGGTQIAEILSIFTELSPDWLLTGRGEMLRKNVENINNSSDVIVSGDNNNNITGVDNRRYYSDSPDVLKAQIDDKDKLLREKDERLREKDERLREKDEYIAELKSTIRELKTK
jgi:hypothetical protein